MLSKSVLKKTIKNTPYVVIFIILVFSLFLFITKSINRDNSSIVYAQDGYININPKFTVNFGNGKVRFESIKSYTNPFEEKNLNILDKTKEYLGIDKEKKGIEISLEEVSYDKRMEDMTDIRSQPSEIEKNFELTQNGSDIYTKENTVPKDTIISRNVYKGVDIQYQIIDGKGLKEEIILNNLDEYSSGCKKGECSLPANRYVFKIKLDDSLQIRKSVTGTKDFPAGTEYITDNKGNYYAHLLPELAKDALGNKTSRVYVNIYPSNGNNTYIYELIVDPDWLLSKDRVFPVAIDPSIIHDSSLMFDAGIFDKTMSTPTNTIDLKDGFLNGEYTSPAISLGDNATLDNIIWTVLGSGTQNVETPYSRLNLLIEENFNDIKTDNSKWGQGAWDLSQQKMLSIPSSYSQYFTLEFWLYLQNSNSDAEEYIIKSNLADISLKDGFYAVNGNITKRPIEYDKWKHIAIVFDVEDKNITLYIDGDSEEIPIEFSDKLLQYVSIGSDHPANGYIDALRIYDRLMTKYEVASNTQYSRTYVTYRIGNAPESMSEWKYISSFTPTYEQREDGTYLNTDGTSIGEYNLLSFLYAGKEEETISITKDPIEQYAFKPVFTASLSGTIANKDNKEIYIRETGVTSEYIENLNIGDTLIIEKDNNSIEGVVESLNKTTGLVKVQEWNGNIPEEGFSESSKVYKWQREYISLFDYKGTSLVLNLKGKIKDIQLLSAYEDNIPASNIQTQYIQYKFIFTSMKSYLTPHLSSVNINYSNAGPRMDQVLRHGKWFNDEGQQSFWWAD